MAPYSGIAEYVDLFETMEPPPIPPFETPKARKERVKKEKIIAHELNLKELVKSYDPRGNSKGLGDPFKTLFVARINYETTEKKLKREFEDYGSIRKVRMIYDKNNKPRGYAFIEFELDKDMKEAYKQADGRKIDGKRVLVDVERGRTISGWLPRRLGGGRGPARGNGGKSRASILSSLLSSKSNKDEKDSKNDYKDETTKISKHDYKERDKDRERRDRHKDKGGRDKEKERKRSRSRDKKKRKDRSRTRGDR